MTNLGLNLVESAEMYPGRALRCEDTTTTYRALADDVARNYHYMTGAQPRAYHRT